SIDSIGDAELDRVERRLDGVDYLPVEIALGDGDLPGEGLLEPRGEAADEARGADIDGDEPQLAFDGVEAQVVDPNNLAAVDVDDLLVHEVLGETDLVGPLLEAAKVQDQVLESGALLVDRSDRRPRDEDLAPVGGHDEAGHRGIALPDGDDEVCD